MKISCDNCKYSFGKYFCKCIAGLCTEKYENWELKGELEFVEWD